MTFFILRAAHLAKFYSSIEGVSGLVVAYWDIARDNRISYTLLNQRQ
jgi:hypothetical protein